MDTHILYEAMLDLTNQVCQENDPTKMVVLTSDLQKVLVEIIDQETLALQNIPAMAAKPNS